MDRKIMNTVLSNSHDPPSVTSRPKIVLVNPNFQRKQTSAGKTIYVNPFFKPPPAPSKEDINDLASSLSSSDSKYEYAQPCINMSASRGSTSKSSNQNLNFVDKNPKTLNPIFKSCTSLKNANGTAFATNSSQSNFKGIDRVASVSSKITPGLSSVSQNSIRPHVSQPKKTYVNPKFLRTCESRDAVVQKKASYFYVNAKKLKLENEAPGKKDNHSLDPKLKYSSVNSEHKICSTLTEGKADNEMTQISSKRSAPPSLKNCSDSQKKISVDSYPTTATCLDVSPSSWSVKSSQKKRMNLLRLRKITRLAQLAHLSRLKKKDVSSKVHIQSDNTNFVQRFASSNKHTSEQFSSKNMTDVQNSVCQIKNNFPSYSISSHSQSFSDKCNSKSDRPNDRIYQPRAYQWPFKMYSKFKIVKSNAQKYHLVLKCPSNKSQSGSVNDLNKSNQPTSKSNPMRDKNLIDFNLKKFVKINNRKQHRNSSQNINDKEQESSLGSHDKGNVSSHPVPSYSQKLLYVSSKKLIRKPALKKDLHKKNQSYFSKNKYIIRNLNLVQSKNHAACFKINFKPSRTSSDVINKRIMQRKVINRYKLLNVPQNVIKAENAGASSGVPGKPTKSQGKGFVLAERSRNSSVNGQNSSFISIGKTKLIRKSVLKRKQRSIRNNSNRRKIRANNSKLFNITTSDHLNKINSQNFSTKSTENSKTTKPVNNSLIAFGKNKLIKKSLLHWQRQVSELRIKRNNVAATSVIQKQLKRLYKSFPENHQNLKLLKKTPVTKQKLANSSFMKNKLLTKKRIALRCKNNIPCEIFHRYGRCKKFTLGKCFKLHDKKYVAICQAFIQGACKNNSCLLSHEIIPQKMPTCLHFLQGACSRDNCTYPHVKLSAKALVCRDFVRGFCSLGLDCNKLHVLVCPESEKNGFCTKRPNCKFAHHKKKKTVPAKSTVKEATLNSATTNQSSKTENAPDLTLESCNEPTKRYFSKSSENEFESFVPERPPLGSLPSFIPLKSCDTIVNN